MPNGEVRSGRLGTAADVDAEGAPARASGAGVHGATGEVDGGCVPLEHAARSTTERPIERSCFIAFITVARITFAHAP